MIYLSVEIAPNFIWVFSRELEPDFKPDYPVAQIGISRVGDEVQTFISQMSCDAAEAIENFPGGQVAFLAAARDEAAIVFGFVHSYINGE